MKFDFKPNTGNLWVNERESDKHPSLKGTINVDGKLYDIAGWEKTSANGKTYFSMKLKDNNPKGLDV